jgi:hypothetical protein
MASGSPAWRQSGGGVPGARGVRGVQGRGKWIEYYLLVLLGRRGREKEQARVRNTAAVSWRPAGARVAVALAEEDSRGVEQDRGRGRATRGAARSWRWRWGRPVLGTWPGKAAASDAKQSTAGG